MSSRAPLVTGRELIAVLERSGFRVVRIRGLITSFGTPMLALRWIHCTRVKRSDLDC